MIYERLIAQHRPRGWKVRYTDRSHDRYQSWAYADFLHKRITCPKIVDRETLFLYLHECGHARLRHMTGGADRISTVEQEYEAECYAVASMRSAGISVPRDCLAEAKGRVRDHIDEADYDVPSKIKRWAKWRPQRTS